MKGMGFAFVAVQFVILKVFFFEELLSFDFGRLFLFCTVEVLYNFFSIS